MLERLSQARRHDRLCAGIVAAAVINSTYRGENAEIVTPLDCIGESQEPSEEEKLEAFMDFLSSIKSKPEAPGSTVLKPDK